MTKIDIDTLVARTAYLLDAASPPAEEFAETLGRLLPKMPDSYNGLVDLFAAAFEAGREFERSSNS